MSSTSPPSTPTTSSIKKEYRKEQQKRREEARKQLRIEQQKKFAAATANVLSSPPSSPRKKIDFTGKVASPKSNKTKKTADNEVVPPPPSPPSLKNCSVKKNGQPLDSDSDRTTETTTKMMIHEDDVDTSDDYVDIEAPQGTATSPSSSSSAPHQQEQQQEQEQEQQEDGTVTNVTDLSQYVGDTLEEQLESFVQAHPVVMFNKTWCLFSIDAQDFLTQQMKVNVHAIEVDLHPQGKQIMNFIEVKTRHTTVPAIFIKGEFLGGFDQVNSLYASGKLQNQYLKGLSQADQCEEFIKKSGIKSMQPLFWFPSTVNAHVVRCTGIITCLLAATSAASTYWFIWGKYIAYGIFFDFILRLFGGSKFSVVGNIATFITSKYCLNLEPKPRHGRPKQFATMCGIMFSGLGSLMFVLPSPIFLDYIGIGFMAGLSGACGMEGFLDFCVGCFIFKYGIKLGLIPK